MHGGPGFDHSGFRPDFDAFADIAQVIYIDHRGNGRSVAEPASTWTLAQWGDDVRGLCDALGIEKPIVFGQSFGGMVAQSYATRHPDHPRASSSRARRRGWIFDASLDLFEKKGGAEARAIAERFWTRGQRRGIRHLHARFMPLYNTKPRAGGDEMRSARRHAARGLSALLVAGCEIHRMDFRDRLAKCPLSDARARRCRGSDHAAAFGARDRLDRCRRRASRDLRSLRPRCVSRRPAPRLSRHTRICRGAVAIGVSVACAQT